MAVYLATISGDLLSGAEHFSYTIPFDSTIQTDDSATLAAVTAAHTTAIATSGFLGLYGSSTSWKNIKVAKVINLATGTLFAGLNQTINHVGGNSTGSAQPAPQLSMCVSTVGGPKANGVPYRGRFYLPMPGWGSATTLDGRLNTSAQTTLLNYAETLLEEINDAVSGRACVVWSRAAGTTSTITSIRLGQAVDTIRSRRRDVPESYATRSIANP